MDQVCGAKQRQDHAVYPTPEQKATTHFLCLMPPLLGEFFDEVPELWEDEFFHREADGVF
jgi:hypothetical protein